MELKRKFISQKRWIRWLLIVPYGIETRKTDRTEDSRELLIVPYGIETAMDYNRINLSHSFNRTLWN